MKLISGVYQIQSKIKPERIYIGSSVNIFSRWKEHLGSLRINKHHSIKLQNHANKYGIDDLQFSIIRIVSKERLIKLEQFFLDGRTPYFNIRKIAGKHLEYHCSEETKKKLSKGSKGRKPMLGKTHSAESKKQMSIAHKGKKHSPEHIINLTIAHRKRPPVSEETKLKISLSQSNRRHFKNEKNESYYV